MTTSAATRSTQLYCGAQGLSNFENTKCVDDHPKTRAVTLVAKQRESAPLRINGFSRFRRKKDVTKYHSFGGPQSAPGRMLATLQSPPRGSLKEPRNQH